MSKSVLWTVIKLFRLPSVIAMNMFIVLPLSLYSGDIGFAVWQDFPYFLLIAGEIALNDCCDVEKDKINKPQRPLTLGYLNVRLAFMLSFSVIGIGMIIGVYLYQYCMLRLILFMVTGIILSAYNLPFSGIVLAKNILTSVATVLSLSFVFTFILIEPEDFLFLAAAFFFILGREFLMDLRDIEGDSRESYRTLAVIFGESRIFQAAIISFFLSIIFRVLYLFFSYSLRNVILVITQVIIEIVCYVNFKQSTTSQQKNRLIILLWISMLIMLFILLF